MQHDIHAYLRAATSRVRDTMRIGPFLATFSRHSANPFLNYAIPDDGCTPTAADVTALIAAYQQRGRKPRLEYINRLAPAVEPALTGASFRAEGRLPLMTCTASSVRPQPVPEGFRLVLATSDEDLLATVTVQHEAYGESPPGPEDVTALRKSLEAGGLAVLARHVATGEPVGAGLCSLHEMQTTEVAGIGVRPQWRRRGLAGALTTRLAEEAFRAGVRVAFLMAATEVEARIYARAGFVHAGEMLHISYE